MLQILPFCKGCHHYRNFKNAGSQSSHGRQVILRFVLNNKDLCNHFSWLVETCVPTLGHFLHFTFHFKNKIRKKAIPLNVLEKKENLCMLTNVSFIHKARIIPWYICSKYRKMLLQPKWQQHKQFQVMKCRSKIPEREKSSTAKKH